MEIRLAKKEDIEKIRTLIENRIEWMNEVGIKHWNEFDYLNIYSYEYFESMIENKSFYIAEDDLKNVVGDIGLLEKDEFWNDNVKALYIHNLVGDVNKRGVGKFLLEEVEKIAKEREIRVLRLDAKIDDKKLNDYYESFGYKEVGTCTEADYIGYKREKILD